MNQGADAAKADHSADHKRDDGKVARALHAEAVR